MKCVHFVGFRGDEYINAVKVFGQPHYVHPRLDSYALQEMLEDDIIVLAQGEAPLIKYVDGAMKFIIVPDYSIGDRVRLNEFGEAMYLTNVYSKNYKREGTIAWMSPKKTVIKIHWDTYKNPKTVETISAAFIEKVK